MYTCAHHTQNKSLIFSSLHMLQVADIYMYIYMYSLTLRGLVGCRKHGAPPQLESSAKEVYHCQEI